LVLIARDQNSFAAPADDHILVIPDAVVPGLQYVNPKHDNHHLLIMAEERSNSASAAFAQQTSMTGCRAYLRPGWYGMYFALGRCCQCCNNGLV
jgi:hypothetical protein